MDLETVVLDADKTFFSSLLAADTAALDALLVDDFLLVDVLRGAEVPKAALIGAIGAGQVRFEQIDRIDARVRCYGDTAVVTGRTLMRMQFGPEAATVRSRYTHVYVLLDGAWRFVSAQGTPIAE